LSFLIAYHRPVVEEAEVREIKGNFPPLLYPLPRRGEEINEKTSEVESLKVKK